MKNIFKSMMLVAVAAMTFTACEKDNADNNNNNNNGTEQKTNITFTATIGEDDTRSGFSGTTTDDDNKTLYTSAWTGNESAVFTHDQYIYDDGATTVTNTKSGNQAQFEVEFTWNPAIGASIVAVSPASSWKVKANQEYDYDNYQYIRTWSHEYKIPAEQTPTATSVDEAAHILKAETTYDGSDNMSLKFEHQVAYGKLSLTNFAGTDVKQYVLTINGTKYTINASRTENVWFACEPATVTDMSVSVVAAEGTYTKTLNFSQNSLSFVKGKVSTFSVDMNGVTFEEGSGETGGGEDTPLEADYIYDTIKWNGGTYNRFELTDSTGENGMIQFYLNENDRPNNNSIIAKTYKYAGNTVNSPAEGLFSLRYILGSGAGSMFGVGTTKDAATMVVTYSNGVYTILITIHEAKYGNIAGQTFGFKGMPEDWQAPAGGGDETPTVEALPTPAVTASVDGKNVSASWNTVDGAANYTVSVNGEVKEQALTTTTYTFEGEWNTEYTISVVANPENNEAYKSSEAGTASAKVGADPNAGGNEGGNEVEITSITWSGIPKKVTFNSGTENELSLTLYWPGTYNPNGTYSLVAGESTTSLTAHSITVGGNPVTTVSGTLTVEHQQFGNYLFIVTFNDVVIDGVSYTGSASQPW